MCGIVGQARQDQSAPDEAVLHAMCAALEHRGPDSRGVHVESGAGLGIQRLRIIDLQTGDQPIFNETRDVVVVLNGEIYNFPELRSELEGRGHRFSTRSDTEVIVHLYEELGPRCVERLHGMFGLAVWDTRRRRLLIARDRVGKKPMFYALRDGVLTFASELGSLLQDPAISREIDMEGLDAYLAFRYIPSPLTAFRAVRKLPPAHLLVFEGGRATIERYWSLDFSRKRQFDSDEDAFEEVREHLRRATRRRMISDVPLGAFLSGGVDSGAVVAAMAEASATPVKTFSIGFRDSPLDERPLARLVAERFATEHHELEVEPEAIDVLPRLVRHHGEPFADATSIPTYYLSAVTRRHVTVALNGDGGDEAFGGYSRYVATLMAARLDRVPPSARRAAGSLLSRLPSSSRIDSLRSRLRRVGATLASDPAARHLAYMTDLQGLRREDLYTDQLASSLDGAGVEARFREAWESSGATNALDRMLAVDTLTYLPDDLLTKVDIATMACSLEGRSPLLDHELLQFAASLPPRLKVDGREKKVALRRAMRGWLPDEILDAPKRGFQPPIVDWLRGPLRDHARDLLLDRSARDRGWFRADRVETLLDEHVRGVADHSQGLWTLLVLETWMRDVVEAPPAAAVAGPVG
jgi:asparagine synthase (glutamine-hydrolysing)